MFLSVYLGPIWAIIFNFILGFFFFFFCDFNLLNVCYYYCVGSEAFVVEGTWEFAKLHWTVGCFENTEKWFWLFEEGVWECPTFFNRTWTGSATVRGEAKFASPHASPAANGFWRSDLFLFFHSFVEYWCSLNLGYGIDGKWWNGVE